MRTWERIAFGKYAALTLPELVVRHPSYFFWARSERVFRARGVRRGGEVEAKAKTIRLKNESHLVRYEFERQGLDEWLSDVRFRSSVQSENRWESTLDLSRGYIPGNRRLSRRGDEVLTRAFRRLANRKPLDGPFCKRFFNDDENFDAEPEAGLGSFLKLRKPIWPP
ncbi:MAG: hypothetical protein JJ863_17490 [Deltaproteobacteria bacterium]|nr:hypothetical protein [Deltaproteobacteria bacterium]